MRCRQLFHTQRMTEKTEIMMALQTDVKKTDRNSQGGFSLIEIMVGLVIGLLATMVVMQVFTVFETQRKTVEGGADSQTSGNIAFYSVMSDLQMAGYSAMPDSTYSMLKCPNVVYKVAPIAGIEPVVLADDGISDSITIRYGTAENGGAFLTVTDVVGKTLTLDSALGCNKDEIVYITSYPLGDKCAMSKIQGITSKDTGAGKLQYFIELTDDKAIVNSAAAKNSRLACVGNWYQITYAVSNGVLEKNGTPFMTGIVNIQAQYGISAVPTQNEITEWVDPTGAWANPSVMDRNRIKAVRVAFVARNPQRDTKVVTEKCSSLTAAAPTGLCAWDASKAAGGSPAPLIDLSADKDWQHYRYQVFESVIPIRNVIRAEKTL